MTTMIGICIHLDARYKQQVQAAAQTRFPALRFFPACFLTGLKAMPIFILYTLRTALVQQSSISYPTHF